MARFSRFPEDLTQEEPHFRVLEEQRTRILTLSCLDGIIPSNVDVKTSQDGTADMPALAAEGLDVGPQACNMDSYFEFGM